MTISDIQKKISEKGMGVSWGGGVVVLVQPGCCNKTPQTRCLINNGNVFLTVPEAGSVRSGCQPGLVRAFFWVQMLNSILTGQKGPGSSVGLFYKTLIPFMWAPRLWLSSSQRPHLLKSSPWGLVFQHVSFLGEHRHSNHRKGELQI